MMADWSLRMGVDITVPGQPLSATNPAAHQHHQGAGRTKA
jgi:hypothetical protein